MENAQENKNTKKPEGAENKPQAKTPSSLEEAKSILARMEEQNRMMAENLERMEAMRAEEMLSGRIDAGQREPEKKVETNEEYAERAMNGGLNGSRN